MFIGEYQHNLDEKGRLSMPVKFRAKMAGGAVVTKGLDNCLSVYTVEEWEKLAEKLASLPITNSASRAFARLMLAGATQVNIDKQGRVTLPAYLREYAGLQGPAVVAGLFSRVEIWSVDNWRSYKSNTEGDASVIAEELENLGI
ncbi:MAG: division/cell wall cluster transcriptional repressor MraZ [Patescibacteria group bacterium]|nr:division/cell wall cluster transcriptional repressor MraZ [Patescibacteria group bacterium]